MAKIKNILDVFKGMSDITRLRILNLLANRGSICVCDMAKVLEVAQGRLSSHLKILRSSDMVEDKREGLWILYSIPQEISPLYDYQIRCIKETLNSQSPFAEDIEKFDALKHSGDLAQCKSNRCNS